MREVIAGLFWSLLGTAVLFLLVPLLLSCGEAPVSARLYWPESARPVSVLVSVCVPESRRAVAFWALHRADYLEVTEVAAVSAPAYREITIARGDLEPGVMAQTGRWYFPGNLALSSSSIVIGSDMPCSDVNIAHEIGHALGLEDEWSLARPDAVMFFGIDPGNLPALETRDVSPEEEEAVR